MPGAVIGLDCKFYYATGGIGGSPTFVEVPIVQEVSVEITGEESAVDDRSSIWRRYVKGQLDAPITVRMTRKIGDTHYVVFRNASMSRTTVLGIAIATGTVTVSGEEVFMADMIVTSMPFTEALNDVGSIEFQLRLAYNTANAPSFATVSG